MARWHSCNILQIGANSRRVWQFDARKGQPVLNREQSASTGQPLPANLVAKTWISLWQPKLNIAWLPPENVFLRVAQLPLADAAETRTMVEFQLEKLSPLPVTQIVWSIHVLPPRKPAAQPAAEGVAAEPDSTQTVIVIIVARDVVEELLGNLEKDGFLADRLEVPLIDQLQSTPGTGEGVWIYLPDDAGGKTALAAWWCGGLLQSLGIIHLPVDKTNTGALREQLVQMTWAGEFEGWVTTSPNWHLVAAGTTAAEWQAAFAQAVEQPVKMVSPLSPEELASTMARRAQSDAGTNILPPEFATRYHQQFVDRLWMRGLLAALVIYGAGVAVYFLALSVLVVQTRGVEKKVAGISGDYTNALQLKARYQILKDRSDLKYAALDCWKTTAELLPAGATLNGLDFRDGSKLLLNGTAPADKVPTIIDFNSAMHKAAENERLLFSKVESPSWHTDAGNTTISWNFSCILNRTEASP